ncbi:hypothetical protein PCANC_16061 [Puccinia coronata f. sp. avenae]|uniref:Uncharacterized protein n=1 Tax=Puccinia coronata f. sp. avenae TaxID=200324 RepID=A0A2N5UA66_9BASI|nr:hypothetical protein PCANC_16061 [Puccinia coronata f. sp. avenae]
MPAQNTASDSQRARRGTRSAPQGVHRTPLIANTCQAQPHASVTPRQVTSNIARSTNQVKAPVITPSRIIVNTDNEMPFPPRPQQRIPVEAATRGDVGAFHDDLDSFIQPPPPLKFPLEVEVVCPSINTHLSHPAHPRLPHVPPAAPTPNVGSTTRAEVLLESLLASARLSSVDLQLARQLFQAPSNIQWKLLVVMWMMTCLGSQAAPQAAPVLVATVNTPANHVYGSVICSRVQHRIRDILMQHTLESYSQPQSINGRIFVELPLPLIKRYILDQSAAFKREFLPLGLLIGNHKAMASVVTFLRGMVKHKRTHLRNLLLTNAHQEHRPRDLGPIPKLKDLLVLIN